MYWVYRDEDYVPTSKYVSVVYTPQLGSGVDDCKSLTASGARQMEVYRRARDIPQVFCILGIYSDTNIKERYGYYVLMFTVF